jgi:hypothetical protein
MKNQPKQRKNIPAPAVTTSNTRTGLQWNPLGRITKSLSDSIRAVEELRRLHYQHDS